ncbi:Nuclear pore glycoprotein p62 [Oopsacas minuta]|uniref:Nuclear pore glycoprotein p62 n=1 Tax=Oopsacas minuta TaxID=111878 RepID=A0AAV7JVQ7_9METZ|nr:Nuclear pore glycoprotein p62 [Oopsacas minuta]
MAYNFTGAGTPSQDKKQFNFSGVGTGFPGLRTGQPTFGTVPGQTPAPMGQSNPSIGGSTQFGTGMQSSLGQTQQPTTSGIFGFASKPTSNPGMSMGGGFPTASGGMGIGQSVPPNMFAQPNPGNMFNSQTNYSFTAQNPAANTQKPTTATKLFQQPTSGSNPLQPSLFNMQQPQNPLQTGGNQSQLPAGITSQSGTDTPPRGTGLFNTGTTPQGTGLFNTGTTPQGTGLFNTGTTPKGTGLFNTGATAQGTGLLNTGTIPQGTGLLNTGTTPQGTGMFNTGAPTQATGMFNTGMQFQGTGSKPGLGTQPQSSGAFLGTPAKPQSSGSILGTGTQPQGAGMPLGLGTQQQGSILGTGTQSQGAGMPHGLGTQQQGTGMSHGLGTQQQVSILGTGTQAQGTGLLGLGTSTQQLTSHQNPQIQSQMMSSQPQITPQKPQGLSTLQSPSPQTLHMSHLQTTPQNQNLVPSSQKTSGQTLLPSSTQTQSQTARPAMFQLPSSPSTALTAPATSLPQQTSNKQLTAIPTSTTQSSLLNIGLSKPQTVLPTGIVSTATVTTSSVPVVSLTAPSTSGISGQTQTPAKKYTYRQLEDLINNWVMELDDQQKVFMTQAKQVNAWDLALLENEDSIISLHNEVERAKTDQDRLDHDLNSILNQQSELEEMLTPLETYLGTQSIHTSTQHADQERNKTYSMAEKIDSSMKDMMQNLREVLERINTINSANSDRSNPISQITGILNAHMDSLLFIDESSGSLQRKLDELSRKLDSKKQDQEARLQTAFN